MITSPQRTLVLGLAAGVVLSLFGSSVSAQDEQSKRVARQVGIMEKIVDQILLDSPNFLVSGGRNARGVFIEEFGVILTFEASLVDVGDFDWDFEDWGGYEIEDEDGQKVIVIPKRQRDKMDLDDEDDDGGNWRSRREKREARLYSAGKQEMREAIIDYGDTLSRLKDDHWVAIAAFLRNAEYFTNERISRYILKARMRDVRAYASGDIDEDALVQRMIEEEY